MLATLDPQLPPVCHLQNNQAKSSEHDERKQREAKVRRLEQGRSTHAVSILSRYGPAYLAFAKQ